MRPITDEGGSEPQSALLTTAEAARVLRVSVRYVSTLVRQGDLPAIRLGKRAVRFQASDVKAYIERKRHCPTNAC